MDAIIEQKGIRQLNDITSVTPVARTYFENWNIRVVNRETIACGNYLSPNRRDFYKVLFIRDGSGLFSLGMNNYSIEEPTILFLHPNEIISWRNLSGHSGGHYSLFKKKYVEVHPVLKSVMDKYDLFRDRSKSVIRLSSAAAEKVDALFRQMHAKAAEGGALAEDALQAYLQLILIESVQEAEFPLPDGVTSEFSHVHSFFGLLESEASDISYANPVRIKTAREFADHLALHPNYLNALLKKHTGQNISTHIKNRLLEECKALLLQTDWSLQDIGYCIGFADQPNFTQFFKRNIGITPSEFRRNYGL